MTTLKELKHKYSGQPVPQWELDKAGLSETAPRPEPVEDKPKRIKQKVKPVETPEDPVDDGLSD